jgi:hypothetical protein
MNTAIRKPLHIIGLWAALSTNCDAQTAKHFAAELNSGWKLIGDELQVETAPPPRSLFASTGYGVSFNKDGKGFLHQAFWVCASAYEIVDRVGSETGHCTVTDQDGDQLWTDISSKGPQAKADIVGTHSLKGGSGKYKGIEGNISLSCTILPQFHQLACTHTATYVLQ